MKKEIVDFKNGDRFLPIYVYQFPLGDCGGVTDNIGKQSIYIPCSSGNIDYEDIKDKRLIFIEEQRGPNYFALKQNYRESFNPVMFGGNLGHSSDSRCKHIYYIHDRYEQHR
jgi:hypothetical protein